MNMITDNNAMTQPMVAKTNSTDDAVRTYRVIKADASGQLSDRIMLIQAGEWPDSVKGSLKITPADLAQMKMNFDNGIGRPGGKTLGLPIDFSHNEWDQAAGWINALEVEGNALYASVEWTSAGKDAIQGGMYKCISPSFYPGDRGGWQDPEDLSNTVPNVIVGAGLTNIPFFKKLSPVRASNLPDTGGDDNLIYINKSVNAKDKQDMTIDELRVKDAASLTADETAFITAHQSELSTDEKTKFGLVTADVKPVTATIDPKDAQILADIKSGRVQVVAAGQAVIEASRLEALEASAKEYKTEKAAAVVASHVKRGAIKADQADRWTSRLLNASAADRVELETDLESLPSNELIGKEVGSDADVAVYADTRTEIAAEAGKLIAAAREKGETLDYMTAQAQVLASNPDLAERDRKSHKL